MRRILIIRGAKKMENVRYIEKNATNKKLNIASNIKPEWEELCEECSKAAKKVGWTKADSRRVLKETRKELKSIESY